MPTQCRGMLAQRRRCTLAPVHLRLCGTAGGDADTQAAVFCLVLRQGLLLPCPSPVPCHGAATAPLELGRIHTSHQMVPFQISRNYSRNVRSDQIQLWFLGAEKKAFGKGQTLYFDIFWFEKLNSVRFYLKQVELAIQPLKWWTCASVGLSGLHTQHVQ